MALRRARSAACCWTIPPLTPPTSTLRCRRQAACLVTAAHGRGRPSRRRRRRRRRPARPTWSAPGCRPAVVGRAGARTGRRPATGARPAPHCSGAGRRHRPGCRRHCHVRGYGHPRRSSAPKARAVALGRRRAADREAQPGTAGSEALEPRPGGEALEDLAGLSKQWLGRLGACVPGEPLAVL